MNARLAAILLLATMRIGASDAIDRVTGAWRKDTAHAQEQLDTAIAAASRRAIAQLESIAGAASRRGDIIELSQAWKGVLRLDREHAKAREFFAATGQLEAVLAEVAKPLPTSAPQADLPKAGKVVSIAAELGGEVALGRVPAGSALMLQYVSGMWSPRGTGRAMAAMKSPDAADAPRTYRLVIGEVDGQGRVTVLAVVPPGTAKQPHVFRAPRDIENLALWIADARAVDNVGTVQYRVGLNRP